MAIFISDSPQSTEKFGAEYAKNLKSNDVVVLNGEMGAGKTVFCKGVAKALGIDDEILSPTYAYMNDYSGKLYHFDCYRLKGGGQAEVLGLCDYFYAGGVCVIEWADNISSVLPENVKTVTIEKLDGDKRRIIY
ncbi:MAG: tRNA (adenosine(37)-N6)-threonylcarbamoyltransferase complex ATPase subunit type 1 TsaE [Clostridia bacterium]|nr:tRNA (adenosine(37)-N6)-threonylcarbamoyltransferase complex ATPase subunit type 1 TsaE [Clostridia bacterium]